MNRLPFAFGLICGAALLPNFTMADPAPNRHFRAEWSGGSERLEIDIRAEAFRPDKHKITRTDGATHVDGRLAIGIDGTGSIETEITSFNVTWNGERVPIPVEAYAPLYNFSLEKASFFPGEMGQLAVVKSTGGEALLFAFSNGSGSVRQWAWLVVTRNGTWFRFQGDDGTSPL